jgi:hypothetical protein
MITVYRIRRKHLIVLIVSLVLASSFYFIPLPDDRANQQPGQLDQVQEQSSPPTPEPPQLPDSTSGTTRLADQQAVVPAPLEETAGISKPSPSTNAPLPKQASGAQPQPAGDSPTPAASAPAAVEHLSTRDFSISPSPLQTRILPAIQDNHLQ